MKTLIKLLIKLAVFSSIIYGLYFSLYKAGDDEIIVLRDIKNDRVVQVYTSSYNFIWQGIIPWDYHVIKMPLKNSSLVRIDVKIPALSSLNDDTYLIKLSANISYRIDKANLPDIAVLSSKTDIEKFIIEKFTLVSETVLRKFIEPVYDRNNLFKNEKAVTDTIASETVKKIAGLGVILDNAEFISPGYYPDNKLFSEGLVQNKEMRDLDFSNKKQEIILSKKLISEKQQNELYYEKLLKISSLLKDNPEILKFIYIDKMGDDIKVIISSDKTGLPAMFNDSSEGAKTGVKGDVDNLR